MISKTSLQMKKKRPLRIPVTSGLKDLYAMDMYAAHQAACEGQFNLVAFGRLAAAISVVRTALEYHQTNIPLAITTLNMAIDALVAVKKRGDETGLWEITASERPAVFSGINMAEQCIGTLDVALLVQTAARLLQDIHANPDG